MAGTDQERDPNPGPSIGEAAAPGDSRLGRFLGGSASLGDRDLGARSRTLRRVLPFVTGGLLLLVILWPLLSHRADNVTLSYEDIAQRGEQIRVVGAHYTGLDTKGRPFEVSADLALQDGVDAEQATLTGVKARIELADNDQVSVVGGEGAYERRRDFLSLARGIVFTSSSGYRIATDTADVDLGAGVAKSTGRVSGSAPFGWFEAEGFSFDAKQKVLILDRQVRVRLDPGHKAASGQSGESKGDAR